MKKLHVSVFLIITLFSLIKTKAALAVSTVQMSAVEDSYVKALSPSNNYGNAVQIKSSNYTSGDELIAYLKFDLSTLSGKLIQKATLRVVPTLSRTIQKNVLLAGSTDWSETSINWQNKPSLGAEIGQTTVVTTAVGTPLDFSINPTLLQSYAGKVVGLAIGNMSTKASTLEFNSREAGVSSPILIVEYTDGTNTEGSHDVNNDGQVTYLDYQAVVQAYGTQNAVHDIDKNGTVDIFDGNLVMTDLMPEVKPSPTPVPTSSATPTPIPTPKPTPIPSASPVAAGSGIWISKEEIMALPMSGTAWTNLEKAANSDWGSANLADNEASHDVDTLAGALVAVRKNDPAMRAKVIAGLRSATQSSLYRTLELARGLQTYIIAADIINFRSPEKYEHIDQAGSVLWTFTGQEFQDWVRKMLDANVSPHTGGSNMLCNKNGVHFYSTSGCEIENGKTLGGVVCTALRAPNNWGGHARASTIAAALYLNDSVLLSQAAYAHKAFIGEPVSNHLYCEYEDYNNDGANEATSWHTNSSVWNTGSTNKYGVNRKGDVINGIHVSGVLPEDWRRGAEFKWLPTLSGYMWEGMQGYVASAVMLDRAGLVPFNAGDNAVVRSMDMLYGTGEAALNSPVFKNPASSDDTWIPWVVNKYAGTSYPTATANPGKNMGWTDWTHQ